MTARIDRLVTSGVFALDGGEWEVDNNVWIVGDDSECLVIDAPHEADAIAAAVGGRTVTAIACTHAHNDHVNAAVELASYVGAPILLNPEDRVVWNLTYPDREPDGETIVLRINLFERGYLLDAEPDAFHVTDHYRDYPAVLARASAVAPDTLRERIEDAWRMTAPKRLVDEYVSLLVEQFFRWIGGAVTGDLTGWLKDPRLVRAYTLASWLWVAMFLIRLGVQVPLYLAGADQLGWLVTARLVMGWPLFALNLWLSWLIVRRALRRPHAAEAEQPSQPS